METYGKSINKFLVLVTDKFGIYLVCF